MPNEPLSTIAEQWKKREAMKKIIKRIAVVFILLGVICVTICFTLFISHMRSNKVVAQWKQPDDIQYDGYSPYYVSVVERDLEWNPFTGFQRNYAIYAGKNSEVISYGHYIDFTFWPGYEDTVSFIKKTNVDWKPEGITMTMASGHQLFIPQDSFTGGR